MLSVYNLLQGVSYQNKETNKQKKSGAAMGKMHLPGTVPGNHLQPFFSHTAWTNLYAKRLMFDPKGTESPSQKNVEYKSFWTPKKKRDQMKLIQE